MRDRENLINELKNLLLRYVSTSTGERWIESLKPDYSRALRDFKLLKNILMEHELGHSLSFPMFPDIGEVFAYFDKFGVLTGEKLVVLADFINKALKFRERIHSADVSSYLNIGKELISFAEDINKYIDRDGKIKAFINPTLKELYDRRNKLRENLLNAYAKIINIHWDKLRERQPVIKNGRLTLPVISNYQIEGVIHGYSHTTETIFVEPYDIVPLQNQVIQLDDRIREEENRIIGRLITRFLDLKDNLKKLYDNLGFVDSLYARAKFYLDFKCCIPEFSKNGEIVLKNCKEPILCSRLRDKVVPLNFQAKKMALLITGPNAGGKTIALRTIAFAVIMASMGIPIIAEKAIIPYGSNVFPLGFSSMGDVSKDLSHFAAEIIEMKKILEQVKPFDIVIFDEIFSSTDPDESSALSFATAKYLSDRKVYVFISTHFSTLKILASESDFFEVASLEDYSLVVGKVGESKGLKTAEALGLPEEIIKLAKETFEKIPASILKIKEQYERKLKEIEMENRRLKELKRELITTISYAKRGKIEKVPEDLIKEESKISVGKEYFIKSLGIKGEVVEVKGNIVRVKIRNLIVEVDKKDILEA